MSIILSNLKTTVLLSFILAFLFIYALTIGEFDKTAFFMWLLRWLHVISSIMWVGILYYFNFVQIPNMIKIPEDQKPVISKIIAPSALFWFRWGSVATLLTGIKQLTKINVRVKKCFNLLIIKNEFFET